MTRLPSDASTIKRVEANTSPDKVIQLLKEDGRSSSGYELKNGMEAEILEILPAFGMKTCESDCIAQMIEGSRVFVIVIVHKNVD